MDEQPGLAGLAVGAYLGDRSLHNLSEDHNADPWRVFWLGVFVPRSAFTEAGWHFRIYAGFAVVSGWIGSGVLMAFYSY